MTGQPMVEQQRNGTPSPFLSPQPQPPSSNHSNRLLPSPIPPQTASSASSQRPLSATPSNTHRDEQGDGAAVRKSHSHSISSNPHTLASSKASAAAENEEKRRAVRTLPPWVQSADEEDNVDATSLLLPRTPSSARPASHNHMPTPKSNVPGRKFDHAREGAPVTLSAPLSLHASKWQQFAKSSDCDRDRPPSSRGQVVSEDWMKENMPDLEEPWHPIDKAEEEDLKGFWLFSPRRRSRAVMNFHRNLMNHPMVPLVVRMVVLTFSVLALALAGAIFHKSDSADCQNNSSTWMAILVDVVAIVYTAYITYDEYTSKPLGLRSHNAKMRLIFLDLGFIVFDSANLSLAFQALTDERWACRDNDTYDAVASSCSYARDICVRQKALTATLLIALLAWLATFAISTLRLIERVAR